jgi:hypothetical protein
MRTDEVLVVAMFLAVVLAVMANWKGGGRGRN